MALYHKWKVAFVQIPKNASTSIHNVLRNSTDDSHDHELYIELLINNDPELVENYYSFAVVRNPYDRLVSTFEYMRDPIHDYGITGTFEDFVNEFYRRGPYFYTTESIHLWPQARFVGVKDTVLIDDIIKYENLDTEWPKVVEKIAAGLPEGHTIPSIILSDDNVSTLRIGRPWEYYYTDELKEKVYNLYTRDFKLFGYEK
tara:strand:+ start:2250 stop:2852 length:603 start_codon:yes stop_codon:yes gene_type:complete